MSRDPARGSDPCAVAEPSPACAWGTGCAPSLTPRLLQELAGIPTARGVSVVTLLVSSGRLGGGRLCSGGQAEVIQCLI